MHNVQVGVFEISVSVVAFSSSYSNLFRFLIGKKYNRYDGKSHYDCVCINLPDFRRLSCCESLLGPSREHIRIHDLSLFHCHLLVIVTKTLNQHRHARNY